MDLPGELQYQGGEIGMALTAQTLRWTYLNNNQGIIRDRLSNYTGRQIFWASFSEYVSACSILA